MRAERFEAFVAARTPALMRTAFLLTGDAQHAEGVVQEALVRVAPRWRQVVAAGDPEPYVRRALYSVAMDRRRRRSSREVVTAPDDRVFALVLLTLSGLLPPLGRLAPVTPARGSGGSGHPVRVQAPLPWQHRSLSAAPGRMAGLPRTATATGTC